MTAVERVALAKAVATDLRRGDLFVANPDARLADRHLVEVTRVARDGSWADIRVFTWAVAWSKRQPLVDGRFKFPHEPYRPGSLNFRDQEADWERKLAETRKAAP